MTGMIAHVMVILSNQVANVFFLERGNNLVWLASQLYSIAGPFEFICPILYQKILKRTCQVILNAARLYSAGWRLNSTFFQVSANL